MARGIEAWASDTAGAVAEFCGQESRDRGQETGDGSQIAPQNAGLEVTLFAAGTVPPNPESRISNPESRNPNTPTLVVLPCLRRGDRLARFLARVMPGWTWRWGFKSAYGWEQFTFWLGLRRHLKKGGYDILHVQDPMLAYWCMRDRERGRLKTQEILAHGTEEPIGFLRQFPCVQHLAPWHLEQAEEALTKTQRSQRGE